jgi:lipoyl synthase
VVLAFRQRLPGVTVEILTPDFQGNDECLNVVFGSRPDIFNHNIETVRRLTPKVRNKAEYDRTLSVLRRASDAGLNAKSGVMVGHGERREELRETFRDLAEAGCRLLTIGQYLPPSGHHLPVHRFYEPGEFDEMRKEALQYGFIDVAAGPLVRSSYHADVSASYLNIGKSASATPTASHHRG